MTVHSTIASTYEAANAPSDGLASRLWSDKALLRRILMIGGVVLVAGASAYFYLTGGRYVGTDDAYVKAAQLMVSTDVSGLVKDVDVREGQPVKAGDVLFRLDPQPFQIAVENAKATLAQTVLDNASNQADYRRDLEQVSAQAAQVDLTRVTFNRYAQLARENAIA